jgi:glucose uptake protein
MILPVTYASVLVLLLVSLLCLGSWINTFKAAGGGTRWRFELFALDFSVGAMVVLLIAASTLGTLGSDLAYSDRILVAGRTAQALAVIAGAVFNLGNMLLLAAVSILGISTAFPLTIGVALVVNSCFHFRPGNILYLLLGIVIMMAAIIFDVRSARLREAALLKSAKKEAVASPATTQPARAPAPAATATVTAKPPVAEARVRHHSPKPPVRPAKRKARKFSRGILVAILGGVPLGLFVPILRNCIPGDLGLGPYAGMLLFGIGIAASTFVYDFYFLNITIEGSPLTFAAYLQGNLKQHLLGFAGGALCAGGLLAAALAMEAPGAVNVSSFVRVFLPLLSGFIACLFGLAIWKELAVPGSARRPLLLGICLFTCSVALLAFGYTR